MNETIKSIHDLLLRDLNRLTNEIESYTNEADLWKLAGDINNTAGNLCLHLCGNLQHFIGAIIGKNGYIRKRDDEFTLKNVPRAELLQQIKDTKLSVADTLEAFNGKLMEEAYPIEVFKKPMSHISFLIHLSGHLNYHLGQINYHRRILEL
ncbi:DUF1572 family protein [Reichenbachiella sp. MALMAid0571]|uniref:DUF1572 family protein n=1 Tax=Reichenbachiella sp. MALMAid0571 TaxID=3143939 RepID=UPI0032DFAC1C